MLEACIFFAVFDSLLKYLANSFTLGEIALARFGLGALLLFPSFLQQRVSIRRKDFLYLTLRALLGVGSFYSVVLAFKTGTLSVTMVLFYTNPLWALFMGALLLEERLTWERTVPVITAVTGIAILINPWGKGIELSHFYGLAAGIMGGANSVVTRYLRIRHNSRMIYAFQCFVGTLFTLPFFVGHACAPGLANGVTLLIAAGFGLVGQVAVIHAFRFIRAAEGATLLMAEAIFTTIAGIVLFHEPLTISFIAGTVMILGSGIYLGLRTGESTIAVNGEIE